MNEQKPSVGRIVHYGYVDSAYMVPRMELRAAIITEVTDDTVSITVFHPNRPATGVQSVRFSETLKEDHWTWPPRV
jgi:hypothetical protein